MTNTYGPDTIARDAEKVRAAMASPDHDPRMTLDDVLFVTLPGASFPHRTRVARAI